MYREDEVFCQYCDDCKSGKSCYEALNKLRKNRICLHIGIDDFSEAVAGVDYYEMKEKPECFNGKNGKKRKR